MQRVADVAHEDGQARAPLSGLFDDLDKPDPTLAVALARVLALCMEGACEISATELAVAIAVCDASGADAVVYSDRARGSRTSGGIAALQMYSLEFTGTSVFEALNEALRSKVRAKCALFRRYIWMMMHAMREAPAFEGATVYRGVREDLRTTYKKGRTVTWHGFSSCTTSIEVLQSDQFCGASEERTLFFIALTQGRARWIADVSMVETEDEVLLPPNTRVRVDSTLDTGNGLVIVSLTELEPLDPILLFDKPSVHSERSEAERSEEVKAERSDEVKAERSDEEVGKAELETAEQCDAEAQYHTGLAYSYGAPSDKATAMAWYRKAAEQGHMEAQHAVGDAYYDGDGVHVDKCAAVLWWSKAAWQGHPAAQYAVGYALYHGDCVRVDAAAGTVWLRKAAEQGHAEAQDLLGLAYFRGHGVPMDKAAAAEFWLKAAEQGHKNAQFQLVSAYFEGDGVPVDKAEGVVWLRRAAEQGHVDAQDRLGRAYHEGTGVPMDKRAALEWWRNAEMRRDDTKQDTEWLEQAEHGDEDAQYRMGLVLYYGYGAPVDKGAALGWWRKAAERGHEKARCFLDEHDTRPSQAAAEAERSEEVQAHEEATESAEAHFYRGLAYRDGSGVERDEALALKWLQSAAKTHVEAQVELGHMYYVGEGVAQCRAESSRLYVKAREGGSTDALMLGYTYFNGYGVPRDLEEAERWYTKAAEQGSKHAQEHLRGMEPTPPQQKTSAVERYRHLAEQGCKNAMYCMGLAYYRGDGASVDKAAALEWWCKAAVQGHAGARSSVEGMCYDGTYGDGVPVDKAAVAMWYRKAADAQYRTGIALYNGEGVHADKAAAVGWLRAAAEKGHADAQHWIGSAYFFGGGVPVDKAAAVAWYRKAALQGHADAQNQMGVAYYKGTDTTAGFEWWHKAAAQGHAAAQCNLGCAYYEGTAQSFLAHYDAEPSDADMAATLDGDAEAHFYRGLAYRDGSGVERDYALALKWLLRAAETYVEAQVELGHMLYIGEGVAKRRAESIRWYAKARENGSTDALMLGRMHLSSRDFTQSVQWCRKAAEQGSKHARFHLGYAYFYGKGVPIDYAASLSFYHKAAEQGHAAAQYNLGHAYCYGSGVRIDMTVALGWYRRAAEQGHARAKAQLDRNVPLIVDAGCEGERSGTAAWYRKAAEQGVAWYRKAAAYL
jgi:TPR repeat protein